MILQNKENAENYLHIMFSIKTNRKYDMFIKWIDMILLT